MTTPPDPSPKGLYSKSADGAQPAPYAPPSGGQSPYGAPPQQPAAPQYGAPQGQVGPAAPYGPGADYGQYGQPPGGPQYPGPMYPTGPMMLVVPQKNSLGVWSLWLGILSLLCLGALAGIPAVITGVSSRTACKQGQATNPGQGLTGIILGSIGIAWSVFALIMRSV